MTNNEKIVKDLLDKSTVAPLDFDEIARHMRDALASYMEKKGLDQRPTDITMLMAALDRSYVEIKLGLAAALIEQHSENAGKAVVEFINNNAKLAQMSHETLTQAVMKMLLAKQLGQR